MKYYFREEGIKEKLRLNNQIDYKRILHYIIIT